MTSTDRGAAAAAWWPWLVLPAVATGLVSVGVTLAYLAGLSLTTDPQTVVNIPLAIGFSSVAAAIWATRPASTGVRRLGALYSVVGLGSALVYPAYAWAHTSAHGGGSLVGAGFADWVSDWVWALGAAPLIALGILLYPDGLPPSRRWRPAVVVGIAGPTLLVISSAAASLADAPVWETVSGIGFVLVLLGGAVGLAGLVARHRKAPLGGDERAQIGIFALAGALVVIAASLPDRNTAATLVLSLAAGTALPVTVGLAVVRHRLLDPRDDVARLERELRSVNAARRILVTDREEERLLLRRELHDGLGPSLAAIALGLRGLRDEVTTGAHREVVQSLGDEVQRAVVEIRRICDDLGPATLDELGLLPALRASTERLSMFGGPRVVLAAHELPDLPVAVEVAAFRLTMEAVTNAVRHAAAGLVDVDIRYDDGLAVTVADDGAGISTDATPGVGLRAMAERAEELGGWAVVEDAPGGGTRVRAWLPAAEPAAR